MFGAGFGDQHCFGFLQGAIILLRVRQRHHPTDAQVVIIRLGLARLLPQTQRSVPLFLVTVCASGGGHAPGGDVHAGVIALPDAGNFRVVSGPPGNLQPVCDLIGV